MDEKTTPAKFDRKQFLIVAAICLAFPAIGGISLGLKNGLENEFGILLAMASVPVWVLCLLTGIVLLVMRRTAKGLATILGTFVGALVGFGSCLGFGSLLSSL